MNLKLRKKVENEKMYYLVSDNSLKDTYYEFYQFNNYKELPNIENLCYKIMGGELLDAYEKKDFSPVGYKTILLVKHGIIIDGNVINIGTANVLYDLIQHIRFKDLYNVINSFRKKLSIEVLDFYKNKILEIEVEQLSKETQDLFKQLIEKISYNKDEKKLFKEIMFLAVINEYNKAYSEVFETEQRIKSYPEYEEE